MKQANERPLCRCCDCKNLGVIPVTDVAVCEAPIPSVWDEALKDNDVDISLTARDILLVRRCDCFEPREVANA